MINEDKIRQVYASDPKKGFKMLMDNFQVPIYNYIRGCVKTLAQPFSIIYSPVIFSFVYAAFFSFIW